MAAQVKDKGQVRNDLPGGGRESATGWLLIALAAAAATPWMAVWLLGAHPGPLTTAALAGAAILGAAFLLSWAAEAFQMDVSQALGLGLLALIAVLPEYAVDAAFAWRAAQDPAFAPYAIANMTGANRLLIGAGWSAVVLLVWLRTGARAVHLEFGNAVELLVLLAATVYAFFIAWKGELGVFDTVVLGAMFVAYFWASSRAPAEQPHLVGPALTIGALTPARRRAVTYAIFIFAAAAILIAAEPFAHGLVQAGTDLGIDEFLLVQWLAPLASEAPEFIVALLFAWRAQASAGLRTLVASKVNQWTLLVATLPVVYSIGRGQIAALPLDERQVQEIFLTAAQSVLATFMLLNFSLGLAEAVVLLVLFMIQLVVPTPEVRWLTTIVYLILALVLVVIRPEVRDGLSRLPERARAVTRVPAPPQEDGEGPRER